MSEKEYQLVEKPFLNRLAQIGWQIIDQKAIQSTGGKTNVATSLRTDYKQVTLKDTFKQAVHAINQIDGQSWLTDAQLEELYGNITATEKGNQSLYEANKAVFNKLLIGDQVDKNELTGQKNVTVKLINFDNWQANSFIAINQFQIDTPLNVRKQIIPDIVLFVNGLPLIVVECKAVDVASPLSAGIDQIKRYENQRNGEDPTLTEGEERLFHYNLLSIVTHGEEARFGTISGNYEYYYNWKDIFPESYRTFDIKQYSDEEKQTFQSSGKTLRSLRKTPEVRQNVAIQGLLNHEILIDVLQHFSIFLEDENTSAKIVSRYQQYRAAGKIIERIRNNTGDSRSGVVWHTQGSGKSLTMAFFIRKIKSLPDFKDYKVILMVDRVDLQKQLSDTVKVSGYFNHKNIVKSRKEVFEKLSGNDSSVYMVMVHKFGDEIEIKHAKSLQSNKEDADSLEMKSFDSFGVVNDSDRIVLLIDEAHRTHNGDMSDNVFNAFPNAVKIAFTGTPLLTERHKKLTYQRFGNSNEFIDTYKIREAVADRATLDLVYISKTSEDCIFNTDELNQKFEDEFANESTEKKDAIQKRYGTMQAYLENKDRIRKNAEDMVNHYIDNILPNGFKGMVVANSILAAVRYEKYIIEAINKRVELEQAKETPDSELIKKLEFLKVASIVTQSDNNEDVFITQARQKAKRMDAIKNFKAGFDFTNEKNDKENSGVAFLCVCDKLLTGFDAPIAQVMYLDKSLREHDLLQAIARINRTKKGKSKGILVDYYGILNNLKEALSIWGSEEEEDVKQIFDTIKNINEEIPVLESRYKRLVQLFTDNGVDNFEDFINQRINDQQADNDTLEECIDLTLSIPFRAEFNVGLADFYDSYDLLCTTAVAKFYQIPAKRLGYLATCVKERYKDETMDIQYARPKVRAIIDEYVKSKGVVKTSQPVDLLSDKFLSTLGTSGSSDKAKASEMVHATRRHIKINVDYDPARYKTFDKRLNEIMKRYQDNWEQLLIQLSLLREDMKEGERQTLDGLDENGQVFYDIIADLAFTDDVPENKQILLIKLVNEIYQLIVDAINIPHFWEMKFSEQRNLKGDITKALIISDIDEFDDREIQVTEDLMKLAKKRHHYIIG